MAEEGRSDGLTVRSILLFDIFKQKKKRYGICSATTMMMIKNRSLQITTRLDAIVPSIQVVAEPRVEFYRALSNLLS